MRRKWIYRSGQAVAEIADGQVVWAAPDYYRCDVPQTHHVIPDIQPYQSMIDGSMITSRSQHREHLKANGCFEVGNETRHLTGQRETRLDPKLVQSRRERLYYEVDKALHKR